MAERAIFYSIEPLWIAFVQKEKKKNRTVIEFVVCIVMTNMQCISRGKEIWINKANTSEENWTEKIIIIETH